VAGQEDGKLGDPWAIAVDLEGNYVVAEGGNRRIQTFTAAGKYLRKFGWTEGPLQPLDVKVDLNGDIICTSCGTGIGKGVQIFDCHGTYIRSIGPEDDELEPRGVALDRDSNIYVSE